MLGTEAYERVGDVQGMPYRANLGDTKGALVSYQKALKIAEQTDQSAPAATPPAPSEPAVLNEVVVTGTHIVRNGYAAPRKDFQLTPIFYCLAGGFLPPQ